MNPIVSFYLRNVAVMFLLAMPVVAASFGIASFAARDPSSDVQLTGLIGEQLQNLYLLAWPMTMLLALVHSAWMHRRTDRGSAPAAFGRVAAAVATGATLGFLLAVGQYAVREMLVLTAEYSALGLIYGVAQSKVVGLPATRSNDNADVTSSTT